MGAPGSHYWTGTVVVFNMTSNTRNKLNQDALIPRRYSYLGNTCFNVKRNYVLTLVSMFRNASQMSVVLGYAVTAGHFSTPTAIEVAAGAPQDSGGGKVRDRNLGYVSCVEKLRSR